MSESRIFFFDRDGVVNCDPYPESYVLSWEQWRWMPGIFELLREVKRLGFTTVLVTSQRGVGKGLITEARLTDIHCRMQQELADCAFDAIHAYTGLGDCEFEAKPSPQMVRKAIDRYRTEARDCWLLGDADRDVEMGIRAGIGNVIRFRGLKPSMVPAHGTVDRLEEVISLLHQRESGTA